MTLTETPRDRDCEMCFLRSASHWSGKVPVCAQCVVDQGLDPRELTLMGLSDLVFSRSPLFVGTHRYTTEPRDYENDPVTEMTVHDLPRLFTSGAWQDRVRAAVLLGRVRPLMPDAFPCIYEAADSPSNRGRLRPMPSAWVVSADVELLEDALAPYQELWDAYTAQWGPGSRRVFRVGRLSGIAPHGVYQPGATVADVLLQTLLTHTDMRSRLEHAPVAKAVWAAHMQSRKRGESTPPTVS